MESDCEIESISDDEDVEDGDDFKSAGSDLDSEPNSDGEQAITNELEEEDIIEEDFDDMVPLFPAAAKPRTNVPVLQPEDANLSVVHLALKYAFGFPEFRGHQEAVVNAALQGKDILVLMPTGGGKSLCFQLPAVLSRGVTLVITPLISLMYDQVQALLHSPNGGIPVTFISSQRTMKDRVAVFRELEKPHPSIKLLYSTPEQLQHSEGLVKTFELLYQRGTFARLVVDEAHCVSTWGHDFRPDYRKIAAFRKKFPTVPCTALTATATASVRDDIERSLQLRASQRGHAVFRSSCFRSNLTLRMCAKPENFEKADALLVRYLNSILQQHARGAIIVYCLTRDNCQVLADMLNAAKVSAVVYHAGLGKTIRREAQAHWQSGRVRVVVATIAFGMGIDKPDVRAVVHWTIASSIQGYFQEIGRGGRDGQPSECTLFYSPKDANKVRKVVTMGKNGTTKQRKLDQVDEMEQLCQMQQGCRHEALVRVFGDALPGGRCGGLCDLCCERVSRHAVLPLRPGLQPADPDDDAPRRRRAGGAKGARKGGGGVKKKSGKGRKARGGASAGGGGSKQNGNFWRSKYQKKKKNAS